MRPFVLVVAPNPFEDATARAYESDFWLKTRTGHLASFSNLVRLFNRVGASQAPLANPWKEARPLAGYFLESFLKVRGYDARAVFSLDEGGEWAATSARPVAVALSTTFVTRTADLVRTIGQVRAALGPDVPIVAGGQFVWKQHLWRELLAARTDARGIPELVPLFGPHPDPALRDVVYVASEFGEHTLLTLLEALRRGARSASELSGVENLVLWQDEGWRLTRRAPEPVDLDRDFTRWDVVDELPRTMVPVRTSVGCPHECEFCDFVAVHPRLRLRSAASIVDELRLLAARGATSISFVDDNALSSPARARTLARAMCESGVSMRWGGYLRADRLAPDDAALLARSGLAYGWCGIESGDAEMLRRMGKRSDPAAARAGIDSLTAAGVHVLATFVLGFPGETRASLDSSIAFLNGLRRDGRGRVEYGAYPFHVFPGAPVDRPERRRELGLTGLFGSWRHATMSAGDVHATWAPYFFRGVDASYTYYGGDDSLLWSAERRNEAILRRKDLTVAFLDGAPDDVVQDRFAALYRMLRFSAGEPPGWRDCLAGRELQPGAGAAPSHTLPRAPRSEA
jgi:radical SAM superfamily enzyme YgiQ (UPF0313 family)